jgi:3-oxoadipate enol-lactonase
MILRMVLELHATVNGRATRYFEAGSGEPLILVHAFPLNAEMWKPQLERVPGGWRFVVPDLRGLGEGRLDEGTALTMDDYAIDIVALMDALTIDRAVLGGLSMGGYIAFAFHRFAPERVRGLVLSDTRPQGDTAEGARGRMAMLERLRTDGVGAVADELIPKLLGGTTRRLRSAVEAEVRRLIEANDAYGIAGAIHALINRPDSTPDLARIRVPTLVVVGEEDTITPVADAEIVHRGITGSELTILPAAGHLSNLETPTEFSSTVASFLQRSF